MIISVEVPDDDVQEWLRLNKSYSLEYLFSVIIGEMLYSVVSGEWAEFQEYVSAKKTAEFERFLSEPVAGSA